MWVKYFYFGTNKQITPIFEYKYSSARNIFSSLMMPLIGESFDYNFIFEQQFKASFEQCFYFYERLSVNIENSPSKMKFRNTSFSVRKNLLVKHFRKSQSKFPKNFYFRVNRQKVKCCPTPYSRRSKTFWIIPFSKPSWRKAVQGNNFIFGR